MGQATPVRTYQATLLQIDKPINMSVQMPAGALPGRGGIQTSFVAKLGGELPGVREYMAAYPYTCFEQNTSKAIALQDQEAWNKLAASLPAYLDSDGMLKYFPIMEQGSDSLTAYVLSATREAGYAIPEQTKNRMEAALTAFVQGRIVRRSALATTDLAVRKLAALEALSRSNKVPPDALESISISPNLWPTSAVIDWSLLLQRTPSLARRDALLAEAQQILRSRLNFQGTTMGFSTERKDNWWWLMVVRRRQRQPPAAGRDGQPGVERRHRPPGARQHGPPEEGPLGYDGGQRLGHPGHRQVLGQVRIHTR